MKHNEDANHENVADHRIQCLPASCIRKTQLSNKPLKSTLKHNASSIKKTITFMFLFNWPSLDLSRLGWVSRRESLRNIKRFYGAVTLPVTQPTPSKQWKTLKALTPNRENHRLDLILYEPTIWPLTEEDAAPFHKQTQTFYSHYTAQPMTASTPWFFFLQLFWKRTLGMTCPRRSVVNVLERRVHWRVTCLKRLVQSLVQARPPSWLHCTVVECRSANFPCPTLHL